MTSPLKCAVCIRRRCFGFGTLLHTAQFYRPSHAVRSECFQQLLEAMLMILSDENLSRDGFLSKL